MDKLFIHVDSATQAVVEWSEGGKYDSRCTRSSVETAAEIKAVHSGCGAAVGGQISFEATTAAGNSNGEFKSCAKVFVRECSFHLDNAYDPHHPQKSIFTLSEEFLEDAQLLADKDIVNKHDIADFCDKYGNVVLTEVEVGLMAVCERQIEIQRRGQKFF